MINVKSALTTAEGTGTIIPEKLDPILVEEANKLTPVREFLRRIPWSTNAYECNVRTALAASSFYNETSTFGDDKSTYVRRAFIVKMLKAEGAVSQLLQDTSKDYINALQAEIDGALRSLVQFEENKLINANQDAVEADGFNGLRKQITQTEDAAGSTITTAILDNAILKCQAAGGNPNLIIMAPRDAMKLNQLTAVYRYYANYAYETKAGTKLVMYSNIPIMVSSYMPTTLQYGTTPTLEYSEVLVLDTSQIVVPVVREVTYQLLQSTIDGTAFRLKMYETLACKSPTTSCRITNVGKP